MVANWCPHEPKAAFEFVSCFCGLTGKNANPFAPWPSTTTTTPRPSPAPPLPPPRPTPAPPSPGPLCELSPRCLQGLRSQFDCWPIVQNGGHKCYEALKLHQAVLTKTYGCPNFQDSKQPILQSEAFCWCGLDSTSTDSSLEEKALTLSSSAGKLPVSVQGQSGLCRTGQDGAILSRTPKAILEADEFACAQQAKDYMNYSAPWLPQTNCPTPCPDEVPPWFPDKLCPTCMDSVGSLCMLEKLGLTTTCSTCWGNVITCGITQCADHCACGYETSACKTCMQSNCKPTFVVCTGWPGLSTSFGISNTALPSIEYV